MAAAARREEELRAELARLEAAATEREVRQSRQASERESQHAAAVENLRAEMQLLRAEAPKTPEMRQFLVGCSLLSSGASRLI